MKEINFKENLKLLRLSAGITQAELAKMLNVNQRTISAWEKGVCEPSFELLAKLSEIFHETLDDLVF